jgi:hypothetical protein
LNAETDLVAARQQLDQVRAWSTRWFLGLGGARDELNAILDAPARPAGHDETGQ